VRSPRFRGSARCGHGTPRPTCAGTLIGKSPFKIDAIWQEAYIAWFYPPGREKTHALGALDPGGADPLK